MTSRQYHFQLTFCMVGMLGFQNGLAASPGIDRTVSAHDFWSSTHLIEIKQDSEHSKRMLLTSQGGFETAQGRWVSYSRWYHSAQKDTTVAWMTQVSPSLGIIWGAGTGERGAKYSISPSLKIGVVFQTEIIKHGFLSLKGTTILGGGLKEKSCSADYGDIGGVQEVNCRLAASTLAPADSLKHLLHEKPHNQHQVWLQFTHRF